MKNLNEIISSINRAMNAIPKRVATLAVNFSKERFVEKNWYNTHKEPWAKTRKRKGSTLVSSGALKRSIRKIQVTPSYVVIGTNLPYAKIHNDGGEISGTETVKAHDRKAYKRKGYTRNSKRVKATIVQAHSVKQFSRRYHRIFKARQFIGKSQELANRVSKLISDELGKAIGGQ
jgi:phage gpG-like protein